MTTSHVSNYNTSGTPLEGFWQKIFVAFQMTNHRTLCSSFGLKIIEASLNFHLTYVKPIRFEAYRQSADQKNNMIFQLGPERKTRFEKRLVP